MKLTKRQLQKLIKEEFNKIITEGPYAQPPARPGASNAKTIMALQLVLNNLNGVAMSIFGGGPQTHEISKWLDQGEEIYKRLARR
jgi:hypothetical protein